MSQSEKTRLRVVEQRCSGHCCHSFPLHSTDGPVYPWELEKTADRSVDEDKLIFEIVIPVYGPLLEGGYPQYTCSKLSESGDCTIYETRPGICVRHPVFPVEAGDGLYRCDRGSECTFRESL